MASKNRNIGGMLIAVFLLAPALVLLPAACLGFDLWRVIAWLVSSGAFAALFSQWGEFLKGDLSGLLIDRRNRYSLSRLQMLLWTVLTIPAIAVALGSNALRASDVGVFPELILDWNLVLLMGISLSSFVLAPTALAVRMQVTPSADTLVQSRAQVATASNVATANVSSAGAVVFKAQAADARMIDLVMGEEVGNSGTFDLARIQMLAITIIVWFTYAVMLARVFANGAPGGAIVAKFPGFDNTLLALIAVSHVGYLAGKVTPKTTQQSDSTARGLAGVLTLQSDVERLADQIDSCLVRGGLSATEQPHLERLREQLRQIVAGADKLRDSITKGEDVSVTLATLEGQFAAVRATSRPLTGDPDRQGAVDEPGALLIHAVKQGIGRATGAPMSAGEVWTAADDARLDVFLTAKGLNRADLPPTRQRLFEDVLDLV